MTRPVRARRIARRCIHALAIAAAFGGAHAAPLYHVIDLGPSFGDAINAQGDVAGFMGGWPQRAAVWHADTGTWTPLKKGHEALAINRHGATAGTIAGPHGMHAGRWSPDGTPTLIRTDSADTFATAIDDAGHTYGWYRENGQFNGVQHAFMRADDVTTDLGCLADHQCGALAANDHGVVAGQMATLADPYSTSVAVLANGQWTDLGTLGGREGVGTAVNALGHVAGYADTALGWRHAFLWTGGTLQDLDPAAVDFSAAYGINVHDVVVGVHGDAAGALHAAVWRDGAWATLEAISDSTEFDMLNALGINDDGAIVVNAWSRSGGGQHALVLAPLGAPAGDRR